MNEDKTTPVSSFDDRLLLSRRDMYLKTEPFTYGYVDDFLDRELFEVLNANFPEETAMVRTDRSTGHEDRLHPAWLSLFSSLASASFLNDLDKRFDGLLGPAPEERFFLRFKLSRMKSGEWLAPHTDNPFKPVTFILYFGDPSWKSEYGGGTDIYEPRFWLLRRNKHSIEMPFEWMHLRETIDFVPNRLSFVVKSAKSWHGISPVRCPESLTRNRLRIALELVDSGERRTTWRLRRFLRANARRMVEKRMQSYG